MTAVSKRYGWLAAPVLVSLAVMVFWGATPVLTRIATEDLEPLWVAVLRTVIAGLVAVPLVMTTERRPPASARARLLLATSSAAGGAFSTSRSRKRRRSDAAPVNSPSIAGVSHTMRR